MPAIYVSTQPSVEPILLADAKNMLRVDADITQDDAYISSLITSARDQVESDTSQKLINQTWTWVFDQPFQPEGAVRTIVNPTDWWVRPSPAEEDRWERGFWPYRPMRITFPVRPVASLTSISYRQAGAWASYDISQVRTYPSGDIVFPAAQLPPLADETSDSIQVICQVGFGADGTQVPGWALQAMRFLIDHWYEQRAPVMMGRRGMAVELPLTYSNIIRRFRKWSL